MLDPGIDPPLYPPRIKPAARPLRFPFNLIKLLDNNMEALPEQAYHEPIVFTPGPPRTVVFTGSEAIKTLLFDRHAEFPKGKLQNGVFRPLFGNGMIQSEGRDWRWQRGAAAPLFRRDEILQYGSAMSAAAAATVEKWRAAPSGSMRPIHTDMMHAAFEVISQTMLAGGAPDVIHAIEQGHADYFRAANWWIVYTLFGLPHWLPRPGGRAMRAHERRLRNAIAELVRARRANAAGGSDLLGRLLASPDPETGREMPDDLLVDNIVAFLVAGYDTTAFALTWTLFLIAQSPQWEARMLAEIERVAGSGPVTAAHVDDLVVVRQVLNESLRLYPTAPLIVRDILEDVEIDGVPVRAGTIGFIPIYAIHRHRAYWDDPDRFDPGRFAPDRPKPTRYQFMPFGVGPRICIGATFAMVEATIMLATFVRAARFALAPDFDPQPSSRIFLLPKNGMPMRVTLRASAA
jgi:cytochrome P450